MQGHGKWGRGAEDNEDKTYTQLLNKRMLGGGYYIKQISGQEVWLKMKKIKVVILGRLAAPNPRGAQKLPQLREGCTPTVRARSLATLSWLTDELSFQSTREDREHWDP